VATATAEPLEEPPGASEASSGLTGVPNQGLIPVTPSASSCRFALPTICAPAARRPARQAASWPAGTAASATTRDAAVVGVPATSIRSFTATRSPGPWTLKDVMNVTDTAPPRDTSARATGPAETAAAARGAWAARRHRWTHREAAWRPSSKAALVQGAAHGQDARDGQVQGRAQRGRPRRELGHHRLRRHVHEDVLPVDSGCVDERDARVADPPAVAVVSPRRVSGRAVRAVERRRAVGGAADGVVHPRLRHDGPVGDPPALQEQLAEAGHVAQGRADAAVGHRVA